ncbi:hypothetical protein [Nostoc sp. 106C]
MSVYVGNLANEVTEESLSAMFVESGRNT